MSELQNIGTTAGVNDLPATGSALARLHASPGFQPGDKAITYVGEIDPSTIGTEPRSLERLISQYPYLYQGGNIGTGFTIVNTGTETSTSNGDIIAEPGYQGSISNFNFPGISSNFMSVPDAANLDLTTQMEITFRVAILTPDNRLGNQRIVAKSGTARGYEVFIGYDSQHATLNFTPNASALATATEKIHALPEHPMWYRVTYNSTTGNTKFYWAPDNTSEPSTWYQLGSTITSVNVASVANAELLRIGTYNGTGDMFKGRLFNLIIRNAETAGTTVLNINVATDSVGMTPNVTTTFTATSGQTVTLTTSGTYPNKLYLDITFSLATGNRYGYPFPSGSFSGLATTTYSLQVIWFKVTVGAYSTTARTIYPLFRVHSNTAGEGPYDDNSWGLYFDTFQGMVYQAWRAGGTDNFTELFSSGTGVTVGTGEQIIGIAQLQHTSQIISWLFRYTPSTGTFTYPTSSGTGPVVGGRSLTTSALISGANTLESWQGTTGFTIQSIGVSNIPNIITSDESVGWGSGDVDATPLVQNTLKVVALGQQASYVVGEYWRASADGNLAFASDAVEEGDVLAVTTTTPTWQQIKLEHPSRRKALYRPRYVTFGEYSPADGILVPATDDFFIWTVNAATRDDDTDEYAFYMYGADGYMSIESWDSGSNGRTLYMEICDDDGNCSFINYNEVVHGLDTIWPNGHSSPTLWAMSVNRGEGGEWKGYRYDAEYGYTEFPASSPSSDPVTGIITIDDAFDFFGPEMDEGYSDAIYWAGGWKQGTGVIPDEAGIIRLWERAVYGYSDD